MAKRMGFKVKIGGQKPPKGDPVIEWVALGGAAIAIALFILQILKSIGVV